MAGSSRVVVPTPIRPTCVPPASKNRIWNVDGTPETSVAGFGGGGG
ncbi:hypothetical protein [Nocardia seriolae]|nr:hypothetical protein [Nocardia seriolae]QUN16819.1 hypothetical protein KEC46_32260 [Nocardia seriolae]WKY55448.1 hypothetical protein Q5P07_16350 [Nocardia seriolae]